MPDSTPVVREAQLTAELSANGPFGLETRIPKQIEGFGPVPHAVLLELRVANGGDIGIDKAAVVVSVPAGLRLRACDCRGEPREPTRAAPPQEEPPGFESLSVDGVWLAAKDTTSTYFRIQIAQPGTYPVKAAVKQVVPHEDLEIKSDLRVMEADGELSPHDTASALIDAGEAMLEQPVDTLNGAALHREAGGFVFSTTLAVSGFKQPELRKRLEEALPEHAGPRSGDAYLRALVRSRVRALYDIRRRVKH